MIRLEMKNHNMIITEKLQKHQRYTCKNWYYDYLTGDEISSSNRGQILKQDKFAYLLQKNKKKNKLVLKTPSKFLLKQMNQNKLKVLFQNIC